MDKKVDRTDKLRNSEDVRQFLRGRGLSVDENVVRQVVKVLSDETGSSLYGLYATRHDKSPSICGKGTAYKIKRLYDEGKLQPYVAFLESNMSEQPPTSSDQLQSNTSQAVDDTRTLPKEGKPYEETPQVVWALDPVVGEYRRQHWDRLRELATRLQEQLHVPQPHYFYEPGFTIQRSSSGIYFRAIGDDEDKDYTVRAVLGVEKERLFPCLLAHLRGEFTEFQRFGDWKQSLAQLAKDCHRLRRDIVHDVAEATDLAYIPGIADDIETGLYPECPQFIYEFVLDHVGKAWSIPNLEVRPEGNMMKLVSMSESELALGDRATMVECEEAVHDTIRKYISLALPSQINKTTTDLKTEVESFEDILSLVVERGTFEETTCDICKKWASHQHKSPER